jgi:hypothetical protein
LKSATVASRLDTTPKAAQYVTLSPKTLEKLRCIGGGPEFVRIGGGSGGARIIAHVRSTARSLGGTARSQSSNPILDVTRS